MSHHLNSTITVIGVDNGKNSFHVVGLDERGGIVLRQKWSRGQVEARLTNMPACPIGMEACVGAHHLSRKRRSAFPFVSLSNTLMVRQLARPILYERQLYWGLGTRQCRRVQRARALPAFFFCTKPRSVNSS